jgi:capsular exopolysaccharide synthesis family protein
MSPQAELRAIQDRETTRPGTVGLRLSSPPISLRQHKGSRLVFATEPHGLAVEQYKLLRRRLNALSPRGGLLLVTSPGAGEGKTLTSVNLAWCLAEGGRTTCLVDLDFRAPGVSFALGYQPEWDGVAEVLAEECSFSQAIRQIEGSPLYVLGIRERLQSPAKQLQSSRLRTFMKELQETFEWVIVDMAPAIPMSDVAEVVPYVDGALMVVRSGQTSKSLVGPALDVLGAKAWGVVLNDSIINGSAYYGYYGYGKERSAKERSKDKR